MCGKQLFIIAAVLLEGWDCRRGANYVKDSVVGGINAFFECLSVMSWVLE